MSILTMTGIAFALSMDAVAVSISSGCLLTRARLFHAVRIALFFAVFQAAMPLLGWAAGTGLHAHIRAIDHWVAFGLLLVVGGNMVRESLAAGDGRTSTMSCERLPTLLLLSVATSIDALAVGFSLAMLEVAILVPLLVIGVITFVNCLIGTQIGGRLGRLAEGRMNLAGGVVLIAIGIKIVVEHHVNGI